MKILGVMLFFFSLTLGAMEMPPALSMPSRAPQVPRLVELAARKCQKTVEQFDPHKGYLRALNNLKSPAITHVIGARLTPHLARSNAQTLQSILEDEAEPMLFRSSYSSVNQNLYENGHGVYDYSGLFFNPPLRQSPDTKYRTVILSEDKAVCVTSNQLSLTLWNVVTGNQIKQIYYPQAGQNYHDLRAIKYSPNGIVFARFREDLDNGQGGKPQSAEHMCAFDVVTGQMLYENLNSGWSAQIGKRFIYLIKSNQLHVHDAQTNQLRAVLTIDTKNRSLGHHISPEDDYVCHVPQDRRDIHIVSTPGSSVAKTQILKCEDNVTDITLNSSGSRLAAMTKKFISIWKPRDGSYLAAIPHTNDEKIHLDSFADNDRTIYTKAQNRITGWDIENKKLLIKKEFPPVDKEKEKRGAIGNHLHTFTVLDGGTLKTWRSVSGEQLHALYSKLGVQLGLKELSALLILEYENEHKLPFSASALEIVQQTQNSLLKQIYEKRYNTVTAAVELESAASCERKNLVKIGAL